jgi:hypothetical protein
MKTSQEIVDYLLSVIKNIYAKPHFYAQLPSELDGALFDYHNILDFALDRRGASTSRIGDLWYDEIGSNIGRPSWWHELVNSPDSPQFHSIIQKWQKVDSELGIHLI